MDPNTNNNMQYEGYNNGPDNALLAMKKKVIIALVVLVGILVVVFLSGRSTIVINASGASGGSDVQYTLTKDDGDPESGSFSGESVSKSVAKGSYRVTVTQGDSSYETFITTKGFLGKTVVSANLQGEASRRFVATNPADCMHYLYGVLLSSTCFNNYGSLQIHRPATAETPPLVENIDGRDFYGPLEGIARTPFGVVAVTQISAAEDEPRGHYAAILGSDLKTANRTRLQGLSDDKIYAIQEYREGFLAYDTELTDFQYFTSISGKPEKVSITKPKDSKYRPSFASVYGDNVVAVFSDAPLDEVVEGEDDGFREPDEDSFSSYAVVNRSGKQTAYALTGRFSEAAACGTDRLCLLARSGARVYDTSGKEPTELFRVADTSAIRQTPEGFIVVTKRGVLRMDTEKREGFIEYSFGKYAYCGITITETGYVVCVEKGDSLRGALLVDQSSKTNDRIDKKALSIAESPAASFVTVYGNFIHVVPEYGDLEYDAVRNLNLYNPQRVAAANRSIQLLVEKLELDKPPYQVINTGL